TISWAEPSSAAVERCKRSTAMVSGGDYIAGGSGGGASKVLVESGTGGASLWGGLAGNNYEVGGAGADLVVGGDNSVSPPTTRFMAATAQYIYSGRATILFGPTISARNRPTTSMRVLVPASTPSPGDGANHDVLVLTAASSELTSFADVQA